MRNFTVQDKDMCYGKGIPVGSASVINNDAPEVEFTAMKHAYARLKLTLLRGTNYDKSKACNIKNITLNLIIPIFIRNVIWISPRQPVQPKELP